MTRLAGVMDERPPDQPSPLPGPADAAGEPSSSPQAVTGAKGAFYDPDHPHASPNGWVPPTESRFKPGNPGGPGRPGWKQASITRELERMLEEGMDVVGNDGKTQRIRPATRIARAALARAMQGSIKHIVFVKESVEGKAVQPLDLSVAQATRDEVKDLVEVFRGERQTPPVEKLDERQPLTDPADIEDG